MASELNKVYGESGKQFFQELRMGRRHELNAVKHDENYSLSASYINELYDLVDENRPLTLFQKIDLEKESNKNFYSFVMELKGIYDYQDIKTLWQLARTEVLMMSVNRRHSANWCNETLDASLHVINENKLYAMLQEKPLAGIVHDGRLSALIDLRGEPDAETLITPGIDPVIFNRIKCMLKLAL